MSKIRKAKLVDWNSVYEHKENGGLSVKEAVKVNMAYLMKLVWHIKYNSNNLWARALRHKYLSSEVLMLKTLDAIICPLFCKA